MERSLEEIMAALAGGDEAYLYSLYERFGDDIRRFLLIANRRLGLRPLSGADLSDVVWSACEAISDAAGGWRPDGGALPWVYARRRLDRVLLAHAGPPTAALPSALPFADGWSEPPPLVVGTDDPPAIVVLDRLVRDMGHPVLVVLQEALELVVRQPENRELMLRYAEQQAAGDRSPSHAVGVLLERTPVSVRQTFCRIRRKLRQLALTDHHFRPLLGLPFLKADDDGMGFPATRRKPDGAGFVAEKPTGGHDQGAAA